AAGYAAVRPIACQSVATGAAPAGGPLRTRHVWLPGRPTTSGGGLLVRAPARSDPGRGGTIRGGQVDARQPAAALCRSAEGPRAARRSRPARASARRAAPPGGGCRPGHVLVLR